MEPVLVSGPDSGYFLRLSRNEIWLDENGTAMDWVDEPRCQPEKDYSMQISQEIMLKKLENLSYPSRSHLEDNPPISGGTHSFKSYVHLKTNWSFIKHYALY